MRRRPSPAAIGVLVAGLALLGLLAYGVAARGTDDGLDDALARGERVPAPAVVLPRLSGAGTGSLSAYRGRVVVLNYWASWCTPCRDESPLLQRWQERIARRGGVVLGIDALDVASDARAFVDEFGLTYPILRDRAGETAKRFGVLGYPETFVVDRGGRIAALRRGILDEAFLEQSVLPLLSEAS